MAHFAKVDRDKVIKVIVAESEFFDTFIDTEPGEWIQTSYNTKGNQHLNGGTPLRGNFAGIGYTYDEVRDAFIEPKPENATGFDEESCTWIVPRADETQTI